MLCCVVGTSPARCPRGAAGDLHGQFGDLQRIFQRLGRPGSDDKVWIFLGDYIDRGEGHTGRLCAGACVSAQPAGVGMDARQQGRHKPSAGKHLV